jgi:hypothetical protein
VTEEEYAGEAQVTAGGAILMALLLERSWPDAHLVNEIGIALSSVQHPVWDQRSPWRSFSFCLAKAK